LSALVVVGVADCQVSAQPGATLITYALGSCIAVVVYDPVARVGGMLHFMLPESKIDASKAAQRPFMFADTGIPLLFRQTYGLGAQKQRMWVWAVGGAQIMNDQAIFDIGKRNHLAIRKLFWKAGVLVKAEDVGGGVSRNVRLDVASGRVWVRTAGAPERELGG
jgi:chemotaxis protein CheD